MLFPAWETFYLVLGGAAGALTGLMFVATAMIANIPDATEAAVHAYATPTVVHLGAVLLLSLVVAAPWPGAPPFDMALAGFGAAGTIYMLIVWRRALRQTVYAPVFEDWLWYTALPLASYVAVVAGAVLFLQWPSAGLFITGGAGAFLLCVGIHNAWDNVVYIAVGRREASAEQPSRRPPPSTG